VLSSTLLQTSEAIPCMWAPEAFFKQATVLIADQPGFTALYLAHALALAGCKVVGPFTSHEELDAWLAAEHEQLSAAVIAVDWLGQSHERISATLGGSKVPCLVVDNAPWRHFSSIPVSFSWPYGAFQVLDAIQRAVLGGIVSPQHSGGPAS
jgi:hypothetical protein